MKTTLRFVLSVVLLVSGNSSSPAQTHAAPATLSGTLTDSSGAGVAGATIVAEVLDSPAPETYRTVSGSDGNFTLTLPAGRVRLRVTQALFRPREFTVTLAPGESKRLDVRLEIERLSARVVVTAETQPQPAESTTALVTVLGREEIEHRRVASLPDLLVTQPGIAISRTGPAGGQTTMFIDGGESNFGKILVDGTPVNEPGGFYNLSNLTLDNVDKVEIVHGAESALYGSDALAGVVQVFTHRGTTRTPALDLFAEGGSFGSARGGGQLSGLVGKFDYSAAAAYFGTDGQGQNDAFVNRTLSGNFGWHFSDTNQFRLTLRNASSYTGVPGQTLFHPANPTQSESLKVFSANASWEFRTGSSWLHRLTGTESRSRDVNANPPFFTSTSDFNRAGFQAQSTFFFRQGSATGGYHYEVENGFPGALAGEHARRNNQAGFLDARWQPVARLTLSAGGRAEANNSFGTRVVPRVGAAFTVRNGRDFWGATRLRFSYGEGIKEPAMDESFGSDPCFPGNPSLRPERSRTVNAGVEQFVGGDRVRVSANYFHNRYRDMISFGFGPPSPGCDFGTGSFFNTDLARARGVLFSLETKPLSWLTLAGNYTFNDTRVLEAPNAFDPTGFPGNRLLRRPLHSGSFLLNAGWRALNFNLTGYFTGRRTDSDFQFPPLGLTRNPGYARFDLAVSYNFGSGISAYVRVANLFDKDYQDALGYPALGQDFRLGMRYTLRGKD